MNAANYQVIVIGGGAAGLLCAMTAAQRGRKVLVIERARQVGRKILMSGGGRCNFTNMYAEPDNYLSVNPHFCKSALARYTQWDFIALVEKHRIAYHEKEAGQLFCDDSSKQIVQMLSAECERAGVDIALQCQVDRVAAKPHNGGFTVHTSQGVLACESLVVASGGLSIPKMGASGFAFELAQQFGHSVIETRAGLVPFTLSGAPLAQIEDLAGLAQDVRVSVASRSFEGAALITHRGLSGPAMLQISSYWQAGEPLLINWLPHLEVSTALLAAKRERPRTELNTVLSEWLPKRLAQRLGALAQVPTGAQGRLADQSDEGLRQLSERLSSWSIQPSGTEGYRTAEVTLGGVNTDELSSSSMASRLQAGLYFVGEAVDVTGHLGGYNFQWAWASGHAAGEVI